MTNRTIAVGAGLVTAAGSLLLLRFSQGGWHLPAWGAGMGLPAWGQKPICWRASRTGRESFMARYCVSFAV